MSDIQYLIPDVLVTVARMFSTCIFVFISTYAYHHQPLLTHEHRSSGHETIPPLELSSTNEGRECFTTSATFANLLLLLPHRYLNLNLAWPLALPSLPTWCVAAGIVHSYRCCFVDLCEPVVKCMALNSTHVGKRLQASNLGYPLACE